ncbi:MAG: phenylalanine--tRNA ligase subunit beta [Acidobacteriota bacterium]
MKFALEWIDEFLSAPQPPDRARALLDQAGLPVESVEETENGPVFDVEITPNRPDAMSHLGLARELAALSNTPLAAPGPEWAPPASSGDAVESLASVVISVPRLCRRFGALLLRGVSHASAPERVAARLTAIGSHPISAAVDATNYALWAAGQPLHAFDFEKIRGSILVVRKARRGETLVTLDGFERRLDASDVVVADAERPVSLAGIMGGLDTAVTKDTRHVLLEAAWWDPVAIRRTARRLGMHTDASHRFERGADIAAIPAALNLAASLILESSGGSLAPGLLDVRGAPFKTRRAALRLSRLRLVAGDATLTLESAAEILARLGFTPEVRGRRIFVRIPLWRHDVRIEDDLVEEVLRVHGYDRLPSRIPPAAAPGRHLEPRRIVEDSLSDGAVASGLFETVGYPFVNREASELPFALWLEASGMGRPISVANPLDETRRDLRATLLPGLLDALSANARHGRPDAGLFEVGRAFGRADGDPENPPSLESRRFAFALGGSLRSHWSAPAETRSVDFFDAKGIVERVVEPWIAAEDLCWKAAEMAGFARGAAAWVETSVGVLGVVGLLSRAERERRSLPENVFAGELLVERIPSRPRTGRFSPYSTFPPVEVDLSFSQPRALPWDEIAAFVRDRALADLESFRVADRYEGASVPGDRTKTTLRLTFRSAHKTLTSHEVNGERDRLAAALQERFGVTF